MKGLKEKQQVSMVTPEQKGEELYKVVELLEHVQPSVGQIVGITRLHA
jgi:hypothetical protein